MKTLAAWTCAYATRLKPGWKTCYGPMALSSARQNFGYMSGAIKDFFERIYYPCLDKTEGLPYALFIRAGNDGLGAKTSIERIIKGLAWRAVQEPLICSGDYQESFHGLCEELGMTMAAGLEAGIF